MSLGPYKDEKTELTQFEKITSGVKKYFNDPLHYIFYGTLSITIIGLFFGMDFSIKYYAILLIMSIIKLVLQIKKIKMIWRQDQSQK